MASRGRLSLSRWSSLLNKLRTKTFSEGLLTSAQVEAKLDELPNKFLPGDVSKVVSYKYNHHLDLTKCPQDYYEFTATFQKMIRICADTSVVGNNASNVRLVCKDTYGYPTYYDGEHDFYWNNLDKKLSDVDIIAVWVITSDLTGFDPVPPHGVYVIAAAGKAESNYSSIDLYWKDDQPLFSWEQDDNQSYSELVLVNQVVHADIIPTTSDQNIDTTFNSSVKVKAITPTKAAQTYTPTTFNQTIASGRWLAGAQTIKGDSNLVAENIKKDVTIFGITGTHEGAGVLYAKPSYDATHNTVSYEFDENIAQCVAYFYNAELSAKYLCANCNFQEPFLISQGDILDKNGQFQYGNMFVFNLANTSIVPEQLPEVMFAFDVSKYFEDTLA